jgi:hypothetical protein
MNNNICEFDSSYRMCRAVGLSNSPIASSGFYYLGY